ncbi:MAG: HAMP domain-containing sensor histidine kinase [Cyanobacteria bacterium P01_G01_bin.38]
MFQTTRRRLALWYTAVTAILLLLFASGIYFYVRSTLVERVDDTLNHVVEIVQRSLVIESSEGSRVLTAVGVEGPPLRVDVESSFRDNSQAVEDDRIDLEWFDPSGQPLWTTFSTPLTLPLHVNPDGETVHLSDSQVLRQITHRVQINNQILGYLRVSHPWFEVSKPSRQLIFDLSFWSAMAIIATTAIGWLLSGLAMAPVRDSYQQLKQFTADASHELRNPIAVIQTNVQVALSDPEPDVDFQQDQLQVIERLTRRLGRLVDNLLFLTRQDSGLVPMQRDPIDLATLLNEVVEEQQAIAQEKHITLGYHPDGSKQYPLSGDRDQLIRLFTNLIANALLYTPSDGSIQVELQPTKLPGGSSYQITVQDTGIGIEAEALAHVFDRFYRVDPARSRRSERGDGSGLGLAIAKAIVTNHQGQINISSEPGIGTTVNVLLPQK